MNVLLIFNMHDPKGALFLNTALFSVMLLFPTTPGSIVPFTVIYALL